MVEAAAWLRSSLAPVAGAGAAAAAAPFLPPFFDRVRRGFFLPLPDARDFPVAAVAAVPAVAEDAADAWLTLRARMAVGIKAGAAVAAEAPRRWAPL